MEVFHSGAWGTVCDDEWDMDDAQVLCRSMGYGDAQSATSGSSYGQGSGNIAFDNVQCSGNESGLFDCTNNGFQVHNCDHSKDAGVSCSGKILSHFLNYNTDCCYNNDHFNYKIYDNDFTYIKENSF